MSRPYNHRCSVEDVGLCKMCGGMDRDRKVLVISIGEQTIKTCNECRGKLATLLIDCKKDFRRKNESR